MELGGRGAILYVGSMVARGAGERHWGLALPAGMLRFVIHTGERKLRLRREIQEAVSSGRQGSDNRTKTNLGTLSGISKSPIGF